MSNISVMGYQMSYPKLTNKMLAEDETGYKKALYFVKVREAIKGMKAMRVNKANKNGTKVTFASVSSTEEFDKYCKELSKEYTELFGEGNKQ